MQVQIARACTFGTAPSFNASCRQSPSRTNFALAKLSDECFQRHDSIALGISWCGYNPLRWWYSHTYRPFLDRAYELRRGDCPASAAELFLTFLGKRSDLQGSACPTTKTSTALVVGRYLP